MKPKMLNGSEIVVECLKEQGVDTVFGYPGGAILNIYDELYKHQGEITHILTSHEQGASHAADGYARATGKVGVCLATSGPGATNLVTGIATAHMDSIPLVAITANVTTDLLGKDSFQEVDIAGITMPVTKHSYIVKDIEHLAPTIRRAFEIAQTGRPGPVLIDITKDVTAAKTLYIPQTPNKIIPSCEYVRELDIIEAINAINESKKPYVFVGGGCISANASDAVYEFVEKIDAPVADTLMGQGVFPADHDRYTGMVGMHGTKISNIGISQCDLLIAVGARFSDRVTGSTATFARNAKIIHIDIDQSEFNKNVNVDVKIAGDAKVILTMMNKRLKQQDHSEWMAKIAQLKEKYPLKYDKSLAISGPSVIEKVSEITKGEAIITTEVGQHQMWVAQYYQFKHPRTFLTSGGLGTMGYGLGAAMGAKMAFPEKTVINFAGDGCFRMNLNEIATAARYQIPVIQIIINNHVLGMVRQWQDLFYGKRYSHTTLADGVDFVKVAQGLGAQGATVHTLEEFEKAFRYALELKKPFVIDCIIDQNDKVWPMVNPGGAIEECFTGEDLEKKNK